jgi:uncharacterized protein YbaR (Trm112 family)
VLPNELVDMMVCPKTKQPLIYFPVGPDDPEAFLLCPAAGLRYAVRDGVPVLLVEEAREVAAAQVTQLVARARQLGLRGAER